MAISNRTAEDRWHLAALVDTHHVVFEVYAQKTYSSGRDVNFGYDVELLAIHVGGTHGIMPGCHRCLEVWSDLRRIAEAVIPEDLTRISRYEIAAFDHALHYYGGNEREPAKVRLSLEVRHKRDWDAPIDPCEERCLHDILTDLKALGVQDTRWAERPPQPPRA